MAATLHPDERIHCLSCGSINVTPEISQNFGEYSIVIVKCDDCLSTERLRVTYAQAAQLKDWFRARTRMEYLADRLSMEIAEESLSSAFSRDLICPDDFGALNIESVIEKSQIKAMHEEEVKKLRWELNSASADLLFSS